MGPVYVRPETVVSDENLEKAGFTEQSAEKIQKHHSCYLYLWPGATEVLDLLRSSSWIKIEGEKISIDEAAAGPGYSSWLQIMIRFMPPLPSAPPMETTLPYPK